MVVASAEAADARTRVEELVDGGDGVGFMEWGVGC